MAVTYPKEKRERISLIQYDKGLVLNPPEDKCPAGSLRRNRGVHPIMSSSIRSRNGCKKLLESTVGAHSMTRFGDDLYFGRNVSLYKGMDVIADDLSGNVLSFAKAPPTAGKDDWLFLCNGIVAKKTSSAGEVTEWGIEPPESAPTAVVSDASAKEIDYMEDKTGGGPANNVTDRWAGTDATLAAETSIIQESLQSMKITIAANKSAIVAATGSAMNISLATFAATGDSSDEDYIGFWLRIDKPERVDSMMLEFSLADTTFQKNVYSKLFEARKISTAEHKSKVSGLGDMADDKSAESELKKNLTDPATDFVNDADQKYVYAELVGYDRSRTSGYDDEAMKVLHGDAVYLPTEANVWTKMFVSKKAFKRQGTGSYGWANVKAVRFVIKTNEQGTAVLYVDDLKMFGGTGMQGDYQYLATFRNSETGTRSNPNNPLEPTKVTGVMRQAVTVGSLPQPEDAQVDLIEIWRTVGNGSLFFKIDEVDVGTTSYVDRVADVAFLDSRATAKIMTSEELPLDNIKPLNTFFQVAGPINGVLFWLSTEVGKRGRIYYSPIGRAEAVKGFFIAGNNSDVLNRLVVHNNTVYAFGQKTIYQIIGAAGGPYRADEVRGATGTTQPLTVVSSPYGVWYWANDGLRVFDGTFSKLIGFEAIGRVFRGESIENIKAFGGVYAAYRKDEYVVSDGEQTLAYSASSQTWRDVGIGFKMLYWDDTAKKLYATDEDNEKTLEVEADGARSDAGDEIEFEIKTPMTRVAGETEVLIDRVTFDVDTGGEPMEFKLLVDNGEIVIVSELNCVGRRRYGVPVKKWVKSFGAFFKAKLTTGKVEIFTVDVEYYNPVYDKMAALQKALN